MKLELFRELKNLFQKTLSGICITTMLMNSDGASNKMQKVLAPASKPNTLEELLPESEKNKEIDADLLGFLDLADITQDYIEDISIKTVSLNNVEKTIYYYVDADNNNNWTYIDFEMDEPIMYSKSKENNDIYYGSEYIDGNIKLLFQDNLEDYFKKQTGKVLDLSKVKTIGDIAIIKRLLDKGNTVYIHLTEITKERITTLKTRGVLKPISSDYSIEDYTTSKIGI